MIFKKLLHLAFAGFLVFSVQSVVAVTEQEENTANLVAVFSILLNLEGIAECEVPDASGEQGDEYEGYDNIIGGSVDDDILPGGAGRDLIWGCSGNDRIIGDVGNDVLIGGSDEDVFVFWKGYEKDKILDFQDDIGTIELDDALWTGSLTVAEVVNYFGAYITDDNGNRFVGLNFGSGDILLIGGLTDINQLLDDIVIV